MEGGTDYDFKINRVRITPLTEHLAANLRATPTGTCGRAALWHAGAAQDITPTGGCAALGLKLPLLERELLKMEETPGRKLLLYLGQIDTEANSSGGGASFGRRPTSYQPPLVQCRQEDPWARSELPEELLPDIRAAALTGAAAKGAATPSMSVGAITYQLPLLLAFSWCLLLTYPPRFPVINVKTPQ